MALTPATPEAMHLLLDGAVAFSKMEATGLRIDVEYLDRAIRETKEQVARMESDLREWQAELQELETQVQ